MEVKADMQAIHILYIGSSGSIHDIKWMSWFAGQPGYKVYMVYESVPGQTNTNYAAALQEKGITLLHSIPSFSASRPLQTWKAIRYLREMIATHNITLAHCLFAAPQALWGPFLGIPFAITTRGSDALLVLPALREGKGIRLLQQKILLGFFARSFRKAAAVTATSGAQADMLRELFGQTLQVQIIRTGVPVDEIGQALPAAVPSGRQLVFSPRFFSPVYGIELQLDTISLLPQFWIDRLHFVFVRGRQPVRPYTAGMEHRLSALEAEKGLSYQVLDEISQAEIFGWYKAAAVTWMTPLSDGTPNSALEAMAAGSPLIVPALPYEPALFNDKTCHILQDRDPASLAGLLISILESDTSEVIAEAKRAVREQGNRDVEMKKLEGIYTAILG